MAQKERLKKASLFVCFANTDYKSARLGLRQPARMDKEFESLTNSNKKIQPYVFT